MKKTILITGGAGYIGSHAVVLFEQAGYKTVIVDNFVNSSLDGLVGIEKILGYRPDFFELDLRDEAGLRSVFEKHSFDGVIHFAGLKSPFQSQRSPLEYHDNNIGGSMALFSLMNEFSVHKIVFSSSAAVYDSTNISPCDEESKLGTQHPYATTKLILEYMLRDISLNTPLKTIALRYFNPVGAHPSGYIGERPNGVPNNLFPYIFDVAAGKREMLSVYGDDYDTIDGTGVRDYIDVNDLVDAHLVAYNYIENMQGNYDVFNIGTGKGTSVYESIKMVSDVTDKDIPYMLCPRRPGDLGEMCANPRKAERILGWKAKRSVSDGVASSWNFVTTTLNG